MENELGSVEWMHNGTRHTRAVTRLMIRWSDGTLSGPVHFTGQLVLGEKGEDVGWIFQPELQPPGTLARVLTWWGAHSPALVLGLLLGAAAYRNLVYFLG